MPQPRRTTWVAVADGGKALLLEMTGPDARPSLSVLEKATLDLPANREVGSDRPGRKPDTGANQRSAMEATDWHDLAQEGFLADFAAALGRGLAHARVDRLILVAPDRALGRLRAALGTATSGIQTVEIGRDLTNHPVAEIEDAIAKVLFPAA